MKGLARAIRSILLPGLLVVLAWLAGFVWFVETLESAPPASTSRAMASSCSRVARTASRMESACWKPGMADGS